MKELIKVYLNEVRNKGDAAIIAICNTKVPSGVFLSYYKRLKPIEQTEDGWQFSEIAKELLPDADSPKINQSAIVIYTIANLLEDEKFNHTS